MKLVAEGPFQGNCPGEDVARTYVAIKPAAVKIEVTAMGSNEGALGWDQPVLIDNKPEQTATVTAHVVDRCGAPLSLGASRRQTTWSLGPACETVAKVVPFDPAFPNSEEMRIGVVGPGTCTATATLLGVTGNVSITVR